MSSFAEAPPGDAKAGKKIFEAKCAHCHTVDKGAGHKTGPSLNGLFGRQSGTAPGFSYSVASKKYTVIWDESTLYDHMPYHKKVFQGKKPQELADLIAYLKEATAP